MRPHFLRSHGHNDALIGIAAGLAVAVITAIWSVATRSAVTTSLMPHDVTLIRFSVAAFFLWPVFLGSLRSYRQARASSLILMLAGAGIPFMWIASTGLTFAPVTHIATLMIVMMPIFVTLISWLVFRETLARSQVGGIATVVAGVLLIAGGTLFLNRQANEWVGDLMFLCSSCLFATFTVTQRRSGLTPWQATALVNVGSTIVFIPIHLALPSSGIPGASLQELAVQALAQGIGMALLGLYFYTVAVGRLGAQRAAIFLALVPPLSTLLGIAFLGEHPSPITLGGIALVMLGVIAVVFGPRPTPAAAGNR
jgi:drug/metabolite transporter (DMT)-like permease